MSGDEEDEKKLAAKERQKEMRAGILAQILDQNARARLNTLAITKPEKAQMVENMLINMAQTGRIGSKLSEDQLKQILTQMSSVIRGIRSSKSSDDLSLLAPKTSEALVMTDIPQLVAMEMSLSKFPRGRQPASYKFLTKGRRNHPFSTAFLGFPTKSDPATAFTASELR
ncbi:DNA-binding protein, partial [Opisthorchis viverrini]